MATTGSAERPGRPAGAVAGRDRPSSGPRAGCGSGFGSLETEAKRCSACAQGQTSGSPACPLCRARRLSGERLRRRSEPGRSSSRPARRDGDSRREFFVSPAFIPKCPDALSAASGKQKVSEDRDEAKRRNSLSSREEPARRLEEPGVLSDSENEEPISSRIRNSSAFIRKTKNSAAFTSGCQRSQSCTDSVEDGGVKQKLATPPAVMDRVGISHSFTAGILLSSENSRSVSAPITAPDRRLTWRAIITPSTPTVLPRPPRPERSISPESNDSISEELNHFKPIVCSPCTPPKRLPDGRLVEPTIVKSTPRNLTRGLQRATSYEASPAVLQKWRQIELDRQSLKADSKATLTSPVLELHSKRAESRGGAAKTRRSPAGRERVTALNKRRLLFEQSAGDSDSLQRQSVKIRVPAVRYSSETTFRGRSDFEAPIGTPESGSGGALFSRSFSPYSKNSGFQMCKLVPKDRQSPRRESDSSRHNQSTSRRGKKREQKTKHLDSGLDSDVKRTRTAGQEALDEQYVHQIQQERQDRLMALKLQRQFDREHQTGTSRRSPDTYFLRSWMSNQNRRRRGLRRSRRINKKH